MALCPDGVAPEVWREHALKQIETKGGAIIDRNKAEDMDKLLVQHQDLIDGPKNIGELLLLREQTRLAAQQANNPYSPGRLGSGFGNPRGF